MMKENKSFRLPIILITIMVFFGHLLPILNYYHILSTVLIFTLLVATINKGRLTFENNFMWFICVIILLFSLISAQDIIITLKFIYMFGSILILKILYEGQSNWEPFLVRSFFIASSVHVLFTILQFLFPSIITSINSIILASTDYSSNIELLNRNAYAGITGQTGINSLFISIFMAIVFSKLISSSNRKLILTIVLLLAILALLLTVKRSQLIVNGAAIVSVLMISSKQSRKSKINLIMIPILLVTLFYLVLKFVPTTQTILEKFTVLTNSSDITNGRMYLWESSINIFKEHPLLGVGAGNIVIYLHEMSHNIYLQLLAEVGLIGLTFFILAFALSLIRTIKIINKRLSIETQNGIFILLVSLYLQIYFLIYGLSGNPLYSINFITTYLLMIAIANSKNKKRLAV